MLINDSSNLQRRQFFALVEQDNERILSALANEYRDAYLTNESEDITSEIKRLGNPFKPEEFEKKLKQLNPNILVEFHPYNPVMKVVYQVFPDGKKQYISAFENSIIPEFCVFTYKEKWMLDPSSITPSFSVSRKDFQELHEDDEDYDPKLSRPGYKYVKIPWNIKKMGWRTILLRLIQHKLCTAEQINNLFFPVNNQEWAAKSGQRKDVKARF